MFCDLRGFSTFAERHSASTVITTLNRYLTEVSEAIQLHGGTIVSYMGDGVMAVFGAPVEQVDHAARAVRAALEIRDLRVPRFNRWFTEQALGDKFGIGIGLCSGPVMSGNVGAKNRLEYTAVGDTTNVAARLQAKNKETGTQLLLSESTQIRVDDGTISLSFVGESELPGRRTPMRMWTIAPTADAGAAGTEAQTPAGDAA